MECDYYVPDISLHIILQIFNSFIRLYSMRWGCCPVHSKELSQGEKLLAQGHPGSWHTVAAWLRSASIQRCAVLRLMLLTSQHHRTLNLKVVKTVCFNLVTHRSPHLGRSVARGIEGQLPEFFKHG